MGKAELREIARNALNEYYIGNTQNALQMLKNILIREATYRTIFDFQIPKEAFKTAYGTPLHIQLTLSDEFKKNKSDKLFDFLFILWNTEGREERNLFALSIGGFAEKANMLLPKIKSCLEECGNWETCDNIGGSALKDIVLANEDSNLKCISSWIHDENLWVKRSVCAAIAEISKRRDYSKASLDILEHAMTDPEKLMKKGVAWALRDISRKYPDNVIQFLYKRIETENPHTKWIIKNSLKKLPTEERDLILSKLSN
jgi:3-methyladenine DNA glycosylase AlkD